MIDRYPPGEANNPLAPYNQDFEPDPCPMCGEWADYCRCSTDEDDHETAETID